MTGALLSAREDWSALRRRFAGEALGNVLAFCGWQVRFSRRAGGEDGLFLTAEGKRLPRQTGSVELLWNGAPLTGTPPDWPGSVPPAAARFFLTARPLPETVRLDFDLAVRRDAGSPYHFTCCAEKRLHTLLSRPGPEGRCVPAAPLTGEARALALAVDRFPAAVRRSAQTLDPFPVNRYALTLAEAARACLSAGVRDRPLLAAAETALVSALGILNLKEASQ